MGSNVNEIHLPGAKALPIYSTVTLSRIGSCDHVHADLLHPTELGILCRRSPLLEDPPNRHSRSEPLPHRVADLIVGERKRHEIDRTACRTNRVNDGIRDIHLWRKQRRSLRAVDRDGQVGCVCFLLSPPPVYHLLT